MSFRSPQCPESNRINVFTAGSGDDPKRNEPETLYRCVSCSVFVHYGINMRNAGPLIFDGLIPKITETLSQRNSPSKAEKRDVDLRW